MDKIGKIVFEIRRLAEEGIICQADVQGLGRMETRVLLEELGISPASARAWGLRGGRRLLIPGEIYARMRGAARRAREAVDRRSLRAISAVLGGGWRYVPAAAWPELFEEFQAARAELAAAREALRADLESIRAEALDRMDRIAREAWRSAWVRSRFPGLEAFREVLRERVRERLDEGRLAHEPDVRLRVFALLLPADLAEERAREAMAREALRQARELARAQAEEMVAPYRAALLEVQARLAIELEAAMASMATQGRLNPKVRARVIRAVHELRTLASFAQDPELERFRRVLDRIEAAARRAPACTRGQPPADRRPDLERFREVLQGILEDLRQELPPPAEIRKILG